MEGSRPNGFVTLWGATELVSLTRLMQERNKDRKDPAGPHSPTPHLEPAIGKRRKGRTVPASGSLVPSPRAQFFHEPVLLECLVWARITPRVWILPHVVVGLVSSFSAPIPYTFLCGNSFTSCPLKGSQDLLPLVCGLALDLTPNFMESTSKQPVLSLLILDFLFPLMLSYRAGVQATHISSRRGRGHRCSTDR